MTINDALNIARNLKFGPLPAQKDPVPSVDEAIALIHEERQTCGFNWLTGEAAEQALLKYKEEARHDDMR